MCVLGLLLLTCFPASSSAAGLVLPPLRRTADQVLLVSNSASPVSTAIANDYAAKRGVKNVLAITCVDSALRTENETMPLADYTAQVETPIRGYLATHPGIDFIVLTKGIPIRIRGATTGWGVDGENNASVDSTLAALDYDKLPGAVKITFSGDPVGYAWLNRYWNAHEGFSHAKFGGYLVTRLDAYNEVQARALVKRALIAEQQGMNPNGRVLLDIQPLFGLGHSASQPAPITETLIEGESPWSDWNADMLHAYGNMAGGPLIASPDITSTFIGHRSHLLGYFSWGSNDRRFRDSAYQSLFFDPGSISETAVSTSARTFLPTEGGQSLLIDLIAHGLTAGKGYVDEPLLQAIASPTIIMDRYTHGYSMAESFYAASHFVGWVDVVVGDPLCTPKMGPGSTKSALTRDR